MTGAVNDNLLLAITDWRSLIIVRDPFSVKPQEVEEMKRKSWILITLLLALLLVACGGGTGEPAASDS
ncbi:MAG: hypothetical protein ACE5E7_14065, partial [Anaerolineae bacterium]